MRKYRVLPSKERVEDLLLYNRETGEFRWRKTMGGRAVSGSLAGSVGNLGYRFIKIDKTLFAAHRLAWLLEYGRPPSDEIDHVDGNRDNNAVTNLRECSRSENMQNQKSRKDNSVGLMGVKKSDGGFVALIGNKGHREYLGFFADKYSAHHAYIVRKSEIHKFQPTIRE